MTHHLARPRPAPPRPARARLGIDLGGTKIEGVILAPREAVGAGAGLGGSAGQNQNERRNDIWARQRIASPQQNYDATIRAIAGLVQDLTQASLTAGDLAASGQVAANLAAGDLATLPLGIGMPGSIAPATGLVQNANSTWLNGRPFQNDLREALGRDVRCANDANCFALSEAIDGAGANVRTVFGVILGTGCGGAIVRDKQLLDGPRAIGGEWGHNPLPWPQWRGGSERTGQTGQSGQPTLSGQPGSHEPANIVEPPNAANIGHELPGPQCWCGQHGCIESWVSGPAMAADHLRVTADKLDVQSINALALSTDPAQAAQRMAARATLGRHASRLARSLATIVNLIDPDLIVLGGGLSKLPHLYEDLPGLISPYIFAQDRNICIVPPRWGDAGGVRGAAWLWNESDLADR